MRSALGAAGCLAKHTSTTKTDKTINIGQRDNFRKYKKLDKHKDTADGFRPLLDAIGFTHCVDPSVLENGVGHKTPDVEEANKWLALVPSRQKLQSAVPYPIELVCKVDRESGREYDPFPGHNE